MKAMFSVLIVLLWACQKTSTPTDQLPSGFEKVPVSRALSGTRVPEVSGIADSKSRSGYLWVEQDSGNPPAVYLLSHDGTVTDSVIVTNATNKDWEDMALAAGPDAGKNYIYLADMGDNNRVRTDYCFYRFQEPEVGVAETEADKILFTYPDGPHDAEAFFVDPATRDIYIITKRDDRSKVFLLAYPQSTGTPATAAEVGALGYNNVTSAAISSDSKEIIVKTYTAIQYYKRKDGESIASALGRTPVVLEHKTEPQGEAIGFAADNSGFYTLSEEALGVGQELHFYKRN